MTRRVVVRTLAFHAVGPGSIPGLWHHLFRCWAALRVLFTPLLQSPWKYWYFHGLLQSQWKYWYFHGLCNKGWKNKENISTTLQYYAPPCQWNNAKYCLAPNLAYTIWPCPKWHITQIALNQHCLAQNGHLAQSSLFNMALPNICPIWYYVPNY